MPVSSTSRKAGPFLGNGVTTSFPFTFKVFAAADVAVYHTDASGVQTLLATGYTVAVNADQETSPGGSVTYPSAGSPMVADESLDVIGAQAYLQGADIRNGGTFQPSVIQRALDYLAILAQQLLEKVNRALAYRPGDGGSTTLPSADERAGKVFTWDDDGDPAVSEDNFASLAAAAAGSAADAADSASGAANSEREAAAIVLGNFLQDGVGAQSRTFPDKMRDVVDLRDFTGGAINEANDYTTELNAAVAQAAGRILQLPANTIRTQGVSAAAIPLFVGHGPNKTKLIHIDGSATPLIHITGGDTGINAYPYDGFRGLLVQAGTLSTALVYFDGRIDNNVVFENLVFNTASAAGDCDGLSARDYLNLNMDRIRWDYVTGWGINIRNANVFSDGHLHVNGFSYDNGLPTVDRGKGLLFIDASLHSATKGVVNLSNGRIELNTKLTPTKPERAIIRVLQNNAVVGSSSAQVRIQFDSVIVSAAASANDTKLVSSNVGTVALRHRNVQYFGLNEEFNNDAFSGRGTPFFINTALHPEGGNRDHATDGVIRGEARQLRGMQEYTASSDSNITSQGGPVKLGDVVHHTAPTNTGGRSAGARPAMFKVIGPNRSGHFLGAASNLAGTGSITSGTASLVMSTALNSGTVPGMAVDVPGAGAAAATLQAVIRSVDYATNTITLDTNASTTSGPVTVAFVVAQYAAVETVTYSAGIPASGTFAVGDLVKNTNFNGTTAPVSEYICTVAGTPGTFRPLKWSVRLSTTANRPALTASDVGVGYMDTTLVAAGKPIWWTSTQWVDATGTAV